MQTIKFTKTVGSYVKGQVCDVDENSAKSLIDRGAAEAYTREPADQVHDAVPVTTGATSQVAQVAAADMPATDVDELPTRAGLKVKLVRYAEGRLHGDDGLPLTVEQLEAMTKDELADKLGLE